MIYPWQAILSLIILSITTLSTILILPSFWFKRYHLFYAYRQPTLCLFIALYSYIVIASITIQCILTSIADANPLDPSLHVLSYPCTLMLFTSMLFYPMLQLSAILRTYHIILHYHIGLRNTVYVKL